MTRRTTESQSMIAARSVSDMEELCGTSRPRKTRLLGSSGSIAETVKVLVGDTHQKSLVARIRQNGWGRMTTRKIVPFPGEPWGFDNGAFACWTRGQSFNFDSFYRRLERHYGTVEPPLVAVLPDRVAAGMDSLEMSIEALPRILKDFPDWPWYLAVQDGMTCSAVEEILKRTVVEEIHGLFLGGTDRFKLRTAFEWRELAHRYGRLFHYARAGSPRRILSAFRSGCDSLDSTAPLWSLEKFDAFERFLMEPLRLRSLAWMERY